MVFYRIVFRLHPDSMVQEETLLSTICSNSKIFGTIRDPHTQHSTREPSEEGDKPKEVPRRV